MQNSNGQCSAFVSSSSVVSDGDNNKDDENNPIVDESLILLKNNNISTSPSSATEDPDDMDSGSASCGGVTIVFLIACIILCLKLFTLPILKNLTSLTKQIRSSTMHPQIADPRIRINAFSMHETFNAPTAASGIPRLPSATFSHNSTQIPTPRINRSRPNSSNNLVHNQNQSEPEQLQGHSFFLTIPPPPSYQESINALPPSYENISNLP
uniref:Uncharacterized protein n=1 Tax=Panagrolaimus sp. PS1159 TaxID=55785 RepID=A0AC35FPV9_9BILA